MFQFRRGTTIDCTGVYSKIGEGIILGDNVGISDNCFIQVRGKIQIETMLSLVQIQVFFQKIIITMINLF